jgi:hypothetical protein
LLAATFGHTKERSSRVEAMSGNPSSDPFAETAADATWRTNTSLAARIGMVAAWIVVVGLVALRALYLG